MGVGSQDGNPNHPPPPPKMRNCPQNRRIWAESPVPTTWQRSLKAPTGRKVDAKEVTWPEGVRGERDAISLHMSCEERISCLYSGASLYKLGGRGIFDLIQRRFILQTSLQRTVNNKNKAGHNSTRGTVSSLLFSRWKVLLHTVYIFNIFNVDWG